MAVNPMRDRIIRAVAAFVKKQTGSVLSVAGFTFYLTSYAPEFARPTSGDALAIDWSLWIHFRGRYWGWGSVRTLARNDDLEIWIGEHGPYTTAGDSIEFPEPGICVKRDCKFPLFRIKNAAPNARDAAGVVSMIIDRHFLAAVWADDIARDQRIPVPFTVRSGETLPFFDATNITVGKLEIKMEPTGSAWISKLYGVPEWRGRFMHQTLSYD